MLSAQYAITRPHPSAYFYKAKIIVTLYIKNVTGALYTVNYNENTLSVSVSVNAAWNSVVLTARRNDCLSVYPSHGLISQNG